MTKKQLISEQDVRAAVKRGESVLYTSENNTLVTAQARSVAKDLGLSIEIAAHSLSAGVQADTARLVRQAIAEQAGGTVNAVVFDEVMRRLSSQQNTASAPSLIRPQTPSVPASLTSPALRSVKSHPMQLIKTCEKWASLHPSRVVFPDALDVRALHAATKMQTQGWSRPILIANPSELSRYCEVNRISMPRATVLNPTDAAPLENYIQVLRKKRPELCDEGARKQLQDPLWYAAMMLVCDDADYCIAGNLSPTASVLRAALRVIGLADGIKTLSSMFFMISPDGARVLGFGDCAVVPEPTSEQLADIAISTAANFQQVTGAIPKVAMLSFSTKGSAKHAAPEQVTKAVELVKARVPDLLIDGELQFDAAVVDSVAALKAPNSPVAGQANVFIFPSLSAGNIGYKIAERLGGYTALGPMIQGLRLPMHDLSRGCSAEDLIQVALLAMKMTPHTARAVPPAT